jgi:predicted dehydrogenase
MTSRPRAAIVGAGLMGRWHAHACRRAGGRVVAIIDVDVDAAQRLAAASGSAACAIALQSLPPSLDLDIVHVCTPGETHVEQVRAALSRGWPAIVEKPLAPTARQTEELLDEARRLGRWVMPVHQIVFQDGVRRAIRWTSGGPIRAVDYRACSAGAEAMPGRADDIVGDILPHGLALIDLVLPGALDTVQWDVHRSGSGELVAAGLAGATAVRLLISMHARPPRHEVTLFADDHTVTADLFHGFAWREPGGTSRFWKIARPFATAAASAGSAAANLGRRALSREPAYPGLTALVREAYSALDAPMRRVPDDRHTLAVARARDLILQRISRA